MNAKFIGIVFIACGALYLTKSDIFQRGLWLKTDLLQRILSSQNYQRFMQILGAALVILGVVFLIV
jgi:hypothetical protein